MNEIKESRAFALGVCAAFCEVVKAGVKRIALSHPFTEAQLAAELGADFPARCAEIAAEYGVSAYHLRAPVLTDLFPVSLNAGKQNIVFYRDPAALEALLGLVADKAALVEAGEYTGVARREIAERFGRLLSYSDEAIARYIAENNEKES